MNEEYKLVNEQHHWNTETNINNTVTTTTHVLVLPIKVKKEKSWFITQACQKSFVPENHLSRHAYWSKTMWSFFIIKDQTKLEHNNDLTYLVKCTEKTRSENYLGETARKINERVIEHAGKDKKSHTLWYTLQSGHPSVSLNEFKILGKGFSNTRVKRKISEVLLIKQYRPTLNTQ